MLEKDIEKAVCDYAAKTYDMLARKYTSPAHRSVPDRLFLGPGNLHFFIEFKKPGGTLTPGQEREIQRLRDRGHRVHVVDTVAEGQQMVDAEVATNEHLNRILFQYGQIVKKTFVSPQLPEEGN